MSITFTFSDGTNFDASSYINAQGVFEIDWDTFVFPGTNTKETLQSVDILGTSVTIIGQEAFNRLSRNS